MDDLYSTINSLLNNISKNRSESETLVPSYSKRGLIQFSMSYSNILSDSFPVGVIRMPYSYKQNVDYFVRISKIFDKKYIAHDDLLFNSFKSKSIFDTFDKLVSFRSLHDLFDIFIYSKDVFNELVPSSQNGITVYNELKDVPKDSKSLDGIVVPLIHGKKSLLTLDEILFRLHGISLKNEISTKNLSNLINDKTDFLNKVENRVKEYYIDSIDDDYVSESCLNFINHYSGLKLENYFSKKEVSQLFDYFKDYLKDHDDQNWIMSPHRSHFFIVNNADSKMIEIYAQKRVNDKLSLVKQLSFHSGGDIEFSPILIDDFEHILKSKNPEKVYFNEAVKEVLVEMDEDFDVTLDFNQDMISYRRLKRELGYNLLSNRYTVNYEVNMFNNNSAFDAILSKINDNSSFILRFNKGSNTDHLLRRVKKSLDTIVDIK